MFDFSKVVQGRREVFDAVLELAYCSKRSSVQAIAFLLMACVAMLLAPRLIKFLLAGSLIDNLIATLAEISSNFCKSRRAFT
jgi:hypothetical protein